MTMFLICFSIFMFALAVLGVFHTEWPKNFLNGSFVYFGFSLMAHIFPAYFLVFSLLIIAASFVFIDPPAWLLVMNALSALLYALMLVRGYKSTEILDAVLPGETTLKRSPFLKGAFLPIKRNGKNVTRIADIAYGDAGVRNLLDIYKPENPPSAPMPVLIHIHGGAWTIGEKNQQARPLIAHLAPKGWIVVDINYRLGPINKMQVIVSDVLKSIAWVKENIADFGGDPNFVALTGGSAGGHLTALAALMPNNKDFKPGFEDVDCSVDAAVPVYGVYDFTNSTGELNLGQEGVEKFLTEKVMPGSLEDDRAFWETVSPISHVRADAPPMFMLHGRFDSLAAFKGAEIFVDALKMVSKNPVLFTALPYSEHAYDTVSTPPTPAHVRAVERFLEKTRAEKAARSEAR